MPNSYDAALDRLRAFRSRWSDGDVVDEQSGLTANDLDQLLASSPPPAALDQTLFAAETLAGDQPDTPDHFAAGFKAFSEGGAMPAEMDEASRELWREGFEHARATAADAMREDI